AASTPLLSSAGIVAATAAQQWAQAISSAVDFSALKRANEALASSAVLRDLIGAQKSWAEAISLQGDFAELANVLARVAETVGDVGQWRARWIPSNLQEIGDLDIVATVALDEGIPLSWVPRGSIVAILIAAPDMQARKRVL